MRIRIAPVPSPFTETMLAAALLRQRLPSPLFSAWRRSLKGHLGPRVRPLAAICPADRSSLDLSTLVGSVGSVDEGIQTLLAVPPQHLRAEMESMGQSYPRTAGPWMGLDSDLQLRRQLGSAIGSFHAAAVGPHWEQIDNFLRAERSYQIQRLATAGIDDFLAALCPPLIQWNPPALDIQTYSPVIHTRDLGGRGLVFEPSVFLSPYASFTVDLRDAALAPRLAYPALREPATALDLWTRPPDGQALAALLGRPRSAALEAIAEGCGTSELARRIGTSRPAASQHATVLRQSGLITTRRHGAAVLHNVTPLGARLLNAQRPGQSGGDEPRR